MTDVGTVRCRGGTTGHLRPIKADKRSVKSTYFGNNGTTPMPLCSSKTKIGARIEQITLQ